MQDLIQPQNSDLQIRENENGVYVAGVSEREVSSMDDCLNLLHIGDRNRYGPTLLGKVLALAGLTQQALAYKAIRR